MWITGWCRVIALVFVDKILRLGLFLPTPRDFVREAQPVDIIRMGLLSLHRLNIASFA